VPNIRVMGCNNKIMGLQIRCMSLHNIGACG
jgi:hypothetical protein